MKMPDFKEKEKLKFPEGFLWGSATSAHQVEGENKNSWSEWEKQNAKRLAREAKKKWQSWQQEKFPEMFEAKNYISGKACDHYNRYESDFDIARELGHNAHRFSIEWSRVEPEEGKFDEKEIEHYRKVILALKERGLEPFVTLWHFTDPIWIEKIGGWENKKSADYFVRYAEKMIELFSDEVRFWISFNEAPTYAGHIHIFGEWLSREKSLLKTDRVIKNICNAHNELHKKISKKNNANINLGIVFNLKCHSPHNSKNIFDKIIAKIDEYFRDTRYLKLIIKHTDFLGLNYYFHDNLQFSIGGKYLGVANVVGNSRKGVSDLGWIISPQGINCVLKNLRRYNLPIYITENGLADADDSRREAFIKEHLRWVHKAIEEGVDVRGYFYWSLLDNFEWDKGYWPRFGLVEVDFKTQERKIRPGAWKYAEICKNNEL